MRVRKAAKTRKTNPRGDEMPAAEPGADVEDDEPAAEVVFEPVELEDDVLDPEVEEDEDPLLVEVMVKFPLIVVVIDIEEEDPEEVEDIEEELEVTPPMSWNCVL